MIKIIVSVILATTMLISMLPLSISADSTESTVILTQGTTASANGTESISYEVISVSNNEFVLTVGGKGALADYSNTVVPWAQYNNSITKIVVEEGITALSSGAFSDIVNLKEISIALSVESISDMALPDSSFILKGYLNHVSGVYAETRSNITFKAKELRILAIGNSHTADWSEWTGNIFSDLSSGLETEFTLNRVIYGGRTLVYSNPNNDRGSHYEEANNPNSATYQWYADAFEKTYDIVIIQDYHESTSTDANDGGANYADNIQIAVNWIHTEAPGAKVVWFADWADKSYNGANLDFSWNQSMKAISAINALTENKPDYIIPASTILQNARTSYLGTTTNKSDAVLNWEDVFTDFATTSLDSFSLLERDTTHMSLELGRYLMGTSVIYHIFNNYKDIISINENFDFFSCLKTAPEYKNGKCFWQGEFVDEYWQIIKETVVNSVLYPYAVTKCSDKYTIDPFDEMYEQVKSVISSVTVPNNPTEADITASYKSESVVSQLSEIDKLNVTADDIIITYTNAESNKRGGYEVSVDCHYGYSYPTSAIVSGDVVNYGDINIDGFINATDLADFRTRILNNMNLGIQADTNGDGIIDARDLVRLKRYLANVKGDKYNITPIATLRNYTSPDSAAWSMFSSTKSNTGVNRFNIDFVLPDTFNDGIHTESGTYTVGGVTKTFKEQYDALFSKDGKSYIGGTFAGVYYLNSGKQQKSGSAQAQLSSPDVYKVDGKSVMFYLKHTYDENVADKKEIVVTFMLNYNYSKIDKSCYAYDLKTKEWNRVDIIRQGSTNYGGVTVPADFEGWFLIPAASFNNSPTEFQHFRIAPSTLGGDYGKLCVGDICVIETTNPTVIQKIDGAVNTTNVALPIDFPLAVYEESTSYDVTPIETLRNYTSPDSSAWGMFSSAKSNSGINRFDIDFVLPDTFNDGIHTESGTYTVSGVTKTFKEQYDSLFNADGKSYIGGTFASVYYLDSAKQQKSGSVQAQLSSPLGYSVDGKSVLFYVNHTYDENITVKKDVAVTFTLDYNYTKINNLYYMYDMNTKSWSKGTIIKHGSTNHGGITIPADFEGWFLIPSSSFNTSPTEFQHFRIAPAKLGGDYGNITVGDLCVIDIVDPTTIKNIDTAANTTSVDLPDDFPLAIASEEDIVLGPQK